MRAKVIADSVCGVTGIRITTLEIRLWKPIQAELNTHRALSRNSASSRAIPAKVIRAKVISDPYVPVEWGQNQKGMAAETRMSPFKALLAKQLWLAGRWPAVGLHYILEKLGLHKQVVNRVLEPWLEVAVLVTATEWQNFFKLRLASDAQPDFRVLASDMWRAMQDSVPIIVRNGWHLPFILPEELSSGVSFEVLRQVSVARCARLSYRLVDGRASSLEEDKALYLRLVGRHWSPFEHQAHPIGKKERSGNFVGWHQYRKDFVDESGGDYS